VRLRDAVLDTEHHIDDHLVGGCYAW
jgi:hypothetical protein